MIEISCFLRNIAFLKGSYSNHTEAAAYTVYLNAYKIHLKSITYYKNRKLIEYQASIHELAQGCKLLGIKFPMRLR